MVHSFHFSFNETKRSQPYKKYVLCDRCKCDDIAQSPPAHWEDFDPKKPYEVTASAYNIDSFLFLQSMGCGNDDFLFENDCLLSQSVNLSEKR